MAVQVDWFDDAQYTVYYRMSDPWNWNEFYSGLEQLKQMQQTAGHPLAVIMDVQDADKLHPAAFTHFRNGSTELLAYVDVVVMFGGNMLFQSVFDVMRRFSDQFARKFKWAHSLEEAQEIVQQQHVMS